MMAVLDGNTNPRRQPQWAIASCLEKAWVRRTSLRLCSFLLMEGGELALDRFTQPRKE